MRRLPLDAYADLARQLLEEPDVFVLITGVADEKPDAVHICRTVGSPRIVDLTGATTMMELLHLFNLAQILITNDSGPAHFACLTGIHVVVFFGPELPDRYRPLARSSDVVYAGIHVQPVRQPLQPAADRLQRQPLPEDASTSARSSDLVKRRLRRLARGRPLPETPRPAYNRRCEPPGTQGQGSGVGRLLRADRERHAHRRHRLERPSHPRVPRACRTSGYRLRDRPRRAGVGDRLGEAVADRRADPRHHHDRRHRHHVRATAPSKPWTRSSKSASTGSASCSAC